MLEAKNGFQTLVRNLFPEAITVHCMMHRQALALKTPPESLHNVLKEVIKTVNYVKGGILITRIFRKLSADMRSEPFNLLYYTKVRWLSEGNVVARVFELQEELEKFLIMQKQHELGCQFKDNAFISRLSDLVDIFDQLSLLNLKLPGKETTIIDFIDTLNAFVQKLENWTRKAEKGNFAMFEILSTVSSNDMDDALSSEILVSLQVFKKNF